MNRNFKKPGKRTVIKVFSGIFIAGILYVLMSFLVSRYLISVTTYKYDMDKIAAPIKIAVLTDEHANAFGRDNARLIKKVNTQNPDLVLIVGDALNSYSPTSSFLTELIAALAETAPVYFAIGNHELAFMAQRGLPVDLLQEEIRRAGGAFLDQSYVDITIKGQALRIGGLFDYVFNSTNVPEEQYAEKDSYLFLKDYCNTDAAKIMMTHRPQSYITDDQSARWPIDLAICGHEHGGQVRLPFLGGFYSTHLGLFPPYLDGYHVINGIPVVISRGLGTYYSNRTPPRWNNVPELIMLELS